MLFVLFHYKAQRLKESYILYLRTIKVLENIYTQKNFSSILRCLNKYFENQIIWFWIMIARIPIPRNLT